MCMLICAYSGNIRRNHDLVVERSGFGFTLEPWHFGIRLIFGLNGFSTTLPHCRDFRLWSVQIWWRNSVRLTSPPNFSLLTDSPRVIFGSHMVERGTPPQLSSLEISINYNNITPIQWILITRAINTYMSYIETNLLMGQQPLVKILPLGTTPVSKHGAGLWDRSNPWEEASGVCPRGWDPTWG